VRFFEIGDLQIDHLAKGDGGAYQVLDGVFRNRSALCVRLPAIGRYRHTWFLSHNFIDRGLSGLAERGAPLLLLVQ